MIEQNHYRLVGERGHADGVELTPEMVELARSNLRRAGLTNCTVSQIQSERLGDASPDTEGQLFKARKTA